jgi:hypothetical protein
VGLFQVVDNDGNAWVEKYDTDGKRVARKRATLASPNPDFVAGGGDDTPAVIRVPAPARAPARQCWNCAKLFHRVDGPANLYACRRHSGNWTEDKVRYAYAFWPVVVHLDAQYVLRSVYGAAMAGARTRAGHLGVLRQAGAGGAGMSVHGAQHIVSSATGGGRGTPRALRLCCRNERRRAAAVCLARSYR